MVIDIKSESISRNLKIRFFILFCNSDGVPPIYNNRKEDKAKRQIKQKK